MAPKYLCQVLNNVNVVAGLGSMGFGMCSNIHAKISSDDELYICDVNQAALDRFVEESKGQAKVEILKTPKDVAKRCVCSVNQRLFHVDRILIDRL